MRIWVDADACPGAVQDIVVNAAHRRAVEAVFVANKRLVLPASPYVSAVQVGMKADAADAYIKEHAGKGDLVITQDIPLAHALVHAGVATIDPRGQQYSKDNIGQRLAMRDLMQGLRDAGETTGGPKQFGDRERRAFAAVFDRELSRLLRSQA